MPIKLPTYPTDYSLYVCNRHIKSPVLKQFTR